ncbi:MAG: penicillin-binding protein [Lachnospiraceae bacterium]|nr:penicillin-binding protein [Lachnospiraceae bacterium]
MSTKKKANLLWCAFVVCLIATVVMWFVVDAQEIEYEEVEVRVLSAETKHHIGTRQVSYEVMVEYNGETYKLENAYNTYQYPQGAMVKAYLANNGRLFANIAGVSTSTPLAKIYFVCLFGSFGLLFVAAIYSGKVKQEKMAR